MASETREERLTRLRRDELARQIQAQGERGPRGRISRRVPEPERTERELMLEAGREMGGYGRFAEGVRDRAVRGAGVGARQVAGYVAPQLFQQVEPIASALGMTTWDLQQSAEEMAADATADWQERLRMAEPLEALGPEYQLGGMFGTFARDVAIPNLGRGPMGRIGGEMLAGGAMGIMQPATTREEAAMQFWLGTIVGGMFAGGGEMVRAGYRGVTGATPAQMAQARRLTQAEKDLDVVGLLTIGELRGSRRLQQVESIFDNVPIPVLGTQQIRENQKMWLQERSIPALKRVFPDLNEEDALSAMQFRVRMGRELVNQKYQKVADLAPKKGPGSKVRATHFRETAERLRRDEVEKGIRSSPATVDFLRKMSEAEDVSFLAAKSYYEGVGTQVRRARRAGEAETADFVEAHVLDSLKAAHMVDIENWARSNGRAVYKAWKEAREAYQAVLLPYVKRPVAGAMGEGAEDYLLAANLMNPKIIRAAGKLDADDAAGAVLLADAIEKSTRGGVIDLRKLATKVNDIEQVAGKIIDPAQRRRLQGFVALTDAMRRAFTPPAVLGTTIGTTAFIGLSAGTGGLGGVTLLTYRTMMHSKFGRSILERAAAMGPRQTKNLQRLAATTNRTLTRVAELMAINPQWSADEAYAELQRIERLPSEVGPMP